MNRIELQKKAIPMNGKIEIYFYENKSIGLKKTLFHRIYIPIEPFNSGLDYEQQPVETEIVIEWMNLNLNDPTNLDGIILDEDNLKGSETTLYLGSVHNPCLIKEMIFQKVKNNSYETKGSILIDFVQGGVAPNERYEFNTIIEMNAEIKNFINE